MATGSGKSVRAAGDGDGEAVLPMLEDIDRLLAVAPEYGIEIRLPEPG